MFLDFVSCIFEQSARKDGVVLTRVNSLISLQSGSTGVINAAKKTLFALLHDFGSGCPNNRTSNWRASNYDNRIMHRLCRDGAAA